jgi:hypothetical protein
MRNVADKSCRENQNTHFMFSANLCSVTCSVILFKNHVVYEKMWKNIVARGTCWINKAADTHSEYVILVDFQQQIVQ